MPKLLSRDEFRTQALARNKGVCVVFLCANKAVDAHHILNRNLFVDEDEFGGYFAENGAGLCDAHHLDAERTLIGTQTLYELCKVERVLPHHLDASKEYDTWGNIIDGPYQRTAGELFTDEGCQKALARAGVMWMFS
jgi:hypothetical protein